MQKNQQISMAQNQIPRVAFEQADPKDHFKDSPLIGQKVNFIKFIVDKLGPQLVEVKMIFNAKENGWTAQDFH